MVGLWSCLLLLTIIASLFIAQPSFANARSSRTKSLLLWAILTFLITLLSVGLYCVLGASNKLKQYYFLSHNQAATQQLLSELKTPNQVIDKLKQQLAKDPTSAQGWFLLGRLYVSLEDFDNAAAAFGKAHALKQSDHTISIQYAQALFFTNQKQLSTEATTLIDEVLQDEPENEGAINLLALNAYQQKDYSQAIQYWEKLLPRHSPDTEDGKELLKAIATAQQALAKAQSPG